MYDLIKTRNLNNTLLQVFKLAAKEVIVNIFTLADERFCLSLNDFIKSDKADLGYIFTCTFVMSTKNLYVRSGPVDISNQLLNKFYKEYESLLKNQRSFAELVDFAESFYLRIEKKRNCYECKINFSPIDTEEKYTSKFKIPHKILLNARDDLIDFYRSFGFS